MNSKYRLVIPEAPKRGFFAAAQTQQERLAELVKANPILVELFGVGDITQPVKLSDEFLFRHVYRLLDGTDLKDMLFETEPVINIGDTEIPAVPGKNQVLNDILLLEQGMICYNMITSIGIMCNVLGIEQTLFNNLDAQLDLLPLIADFGDTHVYAMKEEGQAITVGNKPFLECICTQLGIDFKDTGIGSYSAEFTAWFGTGRAAGIANVMTGISLIAKAMEENMVKNASNIVSYNRIVEKFNLAYPNLDNRIELIHGFEYDEEYFAVEKEVDGISCLEITLDDEPKLFWILNKHEEVTTKKFSKQPKEITIAFALLPFEAISDPDITTSSDVLMFGTVVKPEDLAKPYNISPLEDEETRELVFDLLLESLGLS